MVTVEEIVEKTKKYSFPMFYNENKKQIYIEKKKELIERKFKSIDNDKFPSEEICSQMWNDSVECAGKEFSSLPAKRRLNSFYLQELMYNYASRIAENYK